MHDRPYRTGTTWLTEDQLLLLDVLFNGGAELRLLRRKCFKGQWNLPYTHELDDDALEFNVRWLCEQNVLEPQQDGSRLWFQMTPHGGELWSQERCPVWDRYCAGRYRKLYGDGR